MFLRYTASNSHMSKLQFYNSCDLTAASEREGHLIIADVFHPSDHLISSDTSLVQ